MNCANGTSAADRIIGGQSARVMSRSMPWIVLIILAIVFGAVVASFYVIYFAPALLTQILIG